MRQSPFAIFRLVVGLGLVGFAAAASAESYIKCKVDWSSGGSSEQYFKLTDTSFSYLESHADQPTQWVQPCRAMFSPGSCFVTVTRDFYRATAPKNLVGRTEYVLSINRMTGSLFMDTLSPDHGICEKTSNPLPANQVQKF